MSGVLDGAGKAPTAAGEKFSEFLLNNVGQHTERMPVRRCCERVRVRAFVRPQSVVSSDEKLVTPEGETESFLLPTEELFVIFSVGI